jgi:hypothetical protein
MEIKDALIDEHDKDAWDYFLSLNNEVMKMIHEHMALYPQVDVTNKLIAKIRETNNKWNERSITHPWMAHDGFKNLIKKDIIDKYDGINKVLFERYL